MIKIGFLGVQGSAKTTSVYSIAGKLKQDKKKVNIVEETAREAARRGMPINDKSTVDTQLWITAEHIVEEIEGARDNPQFLLTDRTAFDSLAYISAFNMDEQILISLTMITGAYIALKPYDLILVYYPLDAEPEKDGVRDATREGQKKVETAFRTLLEKMETVLPKDSLYVMQSTTKEARVDEAYQIIKERFY